MSNITFAEPWLLLLAIPALALVIVPFVIAVRGVNRNIHNVLSFVCHLLIVVALVLGIAGMTYDAMITETEVYVLADVSYSSNNNMDILDGYVHAVRKSLPKNSKMSLVAFGRDQQILTDLGDDTVSVSTADKVDRSATDISGAIRFARNLFSENVIKRIVVITDGRSTVNDSKLTSVVSKLNDENIYIDVVYLDNTLADGVNELQVTDVDYSASVFVGRNENAELCINSNNSDQTRVYIDVECNGTKRSYAQTLTKGENRISVPLNTETAGSFEYVITVRPDASADDTSYYNNTCIVTQKVSEKVNVLFIGGSYIDCLAGQKVYGTENVKYVYEPEEVPFTVEALCEYDEIALCNFDVRTMISSEQFVSSLDTVVSKFGKTLTTYGNNFVQETLTKEEPTLDALGGMLPVTMGNSDLDRRMVVFVLDISLSTDFVGRKTVIQAAASKLVSTLNENDKIMIIGYSGDWVEMYPASYNNKKKVLEKIAEYEPRNGTYLEKPLEEAYNALSGENIRNREVVIISDGRHYSDNADNCVGWAELLSDNNVVVSALEVQFTTTETNQLLKQIVYNRKANGKGYYKTINSEADVDIVFDSVIEDMSQVRIEGDSYKLSLLRPQEAVLSGVSQLANINGFWYSSNKSSAVSVVTARYYIDKISTVEVPIYSYWNYGNGRVTSVLTDISSVWIQNWSGDNETRFLKNIRLAMLPDECIRSPFLVTTESEGETTRVSVSTSMFRNSAVLTATVIYPNGSQQTKILSFDTENYVGDFDTELIGSYVVKFVYEYANTQYEFEHTFSVSYGQEYECFTPYNLASLYRIVSDNGEVSRTGELKMDNSASATRSYSFSFTVPLMVFCVILYVLDIIIRMLKWNDIRTIFVHRDRTNK